MKRFFVFFLAVLLTVVLCLQVSAFEYPDLWFFEDGKMVYEAEDESISIWLLERTETSPAVSIVDEKITKYYRAFNANKEILWEVSLSASCEISSHGKIKCQFSVDRDIYQMCRKAPDFRRGDIRHVLFRLLMKLSSCYR